MKYFLLLAFHVLVSASAFAKQDASFKNISLQTQVNKEASYLVIKFDVVLKYSFNQILKQGDSCDQYKIEVRLKQNKLLSVTKGYSNYQDEEGYLKTSYSIPLSNDVHLFENITVMIPLAAIDLPEGAQTIKPSFKLVDKQNRVINNSVAGESYTVNFPQKIRLKIAVKEIEVAETDFSNEFWDYFFVDTNTARPEVCWSVLLAGRKINGSPFTDNSYFYKDLNGNDAVEFTISKNDIFYINVYDFDKLSFSDDVGSLRMDMNETKYTSGGNFVSNFGKVLKMNFAVTVL